MSDQASASSNVNTVQRQLIAIFDPENLAKDNFFRELVERDPEHWVPLKKLGMIKRFKEIIGGDLSLFEQAAALSPADFELNEAKTHLRCITKPEEKKPVVNDNHEDNKAAREEKRMAQKKEVMLSFFETQNKRSIYAKGFSTESEEEPSEPELKAFYGNYGRVLSVRLRREDNKRDGAFKGSIFVEFETPEIAQKVVEEATEFKTYSLTNMIKADYVEMKRVEKFSGQDQEFVLRNLTHRHLVEYSNAKNYGFKDIKELVKAVHPHVGRLEPIDGSKTGCGVVELFKITPEEFLAKLPEQKIEEIQFFLVSASARAHFNKVQKDAQKKGHGGRGGGRGGRGGSRGGRGGNRGNGDKKRGNDNPNNIEVSSKRARTVVEVKASTPIEVKTSTPK